MVDDHAWALHQLTAFFAAVSSATTVTTALTTAVQRAAEALDAEVAAVFNGDGSVTCVGFPEGSVPVARLRQIAGEPEGPATLPHLGAGHAMSVALDDAGARTLLIVRCGTQPFEQQEHSVLRAMGRALVLALRMLATLETERRLREDSERHARENADLAEQLGRRQDLLERLLDIQRAISRRAPLEEVLDTITAGAARLLGADMVALRLLDSHDRDRLQVISGWSLDAALMGVLQRSVVEAGVGGQAIVLQELVVRDDYADAADAIDDFVTAGVRSAMAAPVYINAVVAGSLTVASRVAGRRYGTDAQQMLRAFAEQASLALTDARTLEQLDQAFRDPLTGLPNRTLFLDRLEHALARHRRNPFNLCVLFVDLDRFKYINDSLGHAVGDQLLVAIAQRVQDCMRQADTAARLGGDELAILLEDVTLPQAQDTADRLLAALREPVVLEDREIFMSASIGIAHIADATSDAGELLRNADVAMYKAKHAGGDQHRTFEPGLHTAVLQRLELEGDLRRAVSNDELRLVYQPIVDLTTYTVVGVEALLRWDHPRRGLVPPDVFIPVAEETGMIFEIGRWVLHHACGQAATWQAMTAGRPFSVSVNISARQVQQADFVSEVDLALAESGLSPERLVLELTETALMSDPARTADTLQALKRRGIEIAIDDFGTGYSSLSYLRQFQVDAMKIDRSFVNDIAGHQDTLTDTMVGLAQNMRLNTVAEGIETQAQLDFLCSIGCVQGQGYLFSRPLPPEELTNVVLYGEIAAPGDLAPADRAATPITHTG